MKDTQQLEQMYTEVAKELKARRISKQTMREAITFIGEAIPAIQEYDSNTQIAILGIACYNAGVQKVKAEQAAQEKKRRERLQTDEKEQYRQGARNFIDITDSVAATKAQMDLCFSVWNQWKNHGKYQDEETEAANA